MLLTVLPGYGLLLNLRRLRASEQLMVSGGLSALLCGSAALGCFLTSAPIWLAAALPLALGVVGLAIALQRGLRPTLDAASQQIAVFWLLLLAELTLLEALLPSFGAAGWFADWWVHFHRALVYGQVVPVADVARTCADRGLHCVAPVYDNGVLTTRPPLFNLLTAVPVGLDGGALAAYQLAAVVWSSWLAAPVVALAQRRGLRAGALAGCLLLLNPFLIHLAVYPWPKVLTATLNVGAIYWLCRMRDGAAWAAVPLALSAALAAFTHPAALVYAAAIVLYFALYHRPTGQELRGMAAGILLSALLIVPWVGWGVQTYGWRGVLLSSPTTSHPPRSVNTWFADRIAAELYSFVPVPFLKSLDSGQNAWSTLDEALQIPFDTYPGALGLVTCWLLIAWSPRARLHRDLQVLGKATLIAAALGAVLLDSDLREGGSAGNALWGAVCLGIVYLATLEPAQRHWRGVLIAAAVEMAIVFAVYLGYLSVGPWRQDGNVPVLQGMGQQILSAALGPRGIVAFCLPICLLLLLGIRVLIGRSYLSTAPPEVATARQSRHHGNPQRTHNQQP